MGKVAGAQNFDGAIGTSSTLPKEHGMHWLSRTALLRKNTQATAWISWRPISGAAPDIGESPLPPSRSSVAVTSQSALAIGKMR